ncbi:MAG: hypothetical protein Q9174_006623, partial [Haloplaca sp. 1 TL-2023]
LRESTEIFEIEEELIQRANTADPAVPVQPVRITWAIRRIIITGTTGGWLYRDRGGLEENE